MRELWEAGVNMTISSDDPPIMCVTLIDELREVVRLAGLGRADLAELQRRAAWAAFLPPDERLDLVARIDAWEAEGPGCPHVGSSGHEHARRGPRSQVTTIEQVRQPGPGFRQPVLRYRPERCFGPRSLDDAKLVAAAG